MPASPDNLFARLTALGIETVTHDHEPVFTVDESRHLHETIPGGHSKNLFLKDKKGAIWLVVALEDTEVSLKTLHRTLGSARLSFGKPDLLWEVLGVRPGSVTPFSLINDTDNRVSVVLDRRMMAVDPLNFHPLENHRTTTISTGDLERFIASCGHVPRVLDLEVSTGD